MYIVDYVWVCVSHLQYLPYVSIHMSKNTQPLPTDVGGFEFNHPSLFHFVGLIVWSFVHPSPEICSCDLDREVFSPRDELCVPVVFEAFHGEPFGEARSQRYEDVMGLRSW